MVYVKEEGVVDSPTCNLCGMTAKEQELSEFDTGIVLCGPCQPWVYHSSGAAIVPTLQGLERLGYKDQTAIREQARFLYEKESRQTQNLGYRPLYIPETGPIHDAHWTRLHQKICVSQGLSLNPHADTPAALNMVEIDATLELLEGLGVLKLPVSARQRTLLAHLISGSFGQEAKDQITIRILQWNTRRIFFRDDAALSRSFKWLKEIVEGMESDRALFTTEGITIIGTSGTIYLISPSRSKPFYRVYVNGRKTSVCLNSLARKGEPLGDQLCDIVLGLYNDEATAEIIPILKAVLPKGKPSLRPRCENCNRVLTENANTSDVSLAPQSSADPTRCRTCRAGCSLPEGAQQLGYRQLDRDPVQTWGRGMSATYHDLRWSFIERYRNRIWDEWEEEE